MSPAGANANGAAKSELTPVEAKPGAASADPGLRELEARVKSRDATAEETRSAVRKALRAVADYGRPCEVEWSNIVEMARAQGLVEDAQWIEYVRAAVCPESVVRERVRAGTKIPFQIAVEHPRAGEYRKGTSPRIRISTESVRTSTRTFRGQRGRNMVFSLTRAGGGSTTDFFPAGSREGLDEVRVTYLFEVLDESTGRTIGEWTREFVHLVETVRSEQGVVRELRDESMAGSIRAALRPRATLNGKGSLNVMFDVQGAPTEVGFDVVVRALDGRAAGTDFSATELSLAKDAVMGSGVSADLKSPETTRVDITLRPSMAAVEKTACLSSVWIGPEIVYRDVPVEWVR